MIKKSVIIMIISIIVSFVPVLNAEAGLVQDTTSKTQLFAVPEGGWSTITVEVTYAEEYTTDAYYNNFNKRERSVLFKRAYVTSCPIVRFLNIVHTANTYSKAFSSFEAQAVMYDSTKWDGCALESNTELASYSRTLDVTGKLPFTLECSGATPTLVSGTIDLDLSVN